MTYMKNLSKIKCNSKKTFSQTEHLFLVRDIFQLFVTQQKFGVSVNRFWVWETIMSAFSGLKQE